MPKEYINPPSRGEIVGLQLSIGMKDRTADGRLGPITYRHWTEALSVPKEERSSNIQAPLPVVGLHWDGKNGTVQMSLDVDLDVLQEMIDQRRNLPASKFGDDNSFLRNRVTFYTGALSRDDLQHLVRTARRARNAVFGSDE